MEATSQGKISWASYSALVLAIVALVLAAVALVLSLRAYIFRDRVEWPGVSQVRLNDSDTGEHVGIIQAQYGGIAIRRAYKQDGPGNSTELKLRGDGTVLIDLHEGDAKVASWSLSKDGPQFEKFGSESP